METALHMPHGATARFAHPPVENRNRNRTINVTEARKDQTNKSKVCCAALPGVARGGVTCTSGACQAFACKTGYSLASNATCVAI
ncbi:hypothetical protein CI109_105469 [Kwoniella shandongensis]|uniref:Uncharacterized protein n=1 Tax=Kwoniella shandongensis TaxID=1734106 RepID=A0AAJ8LLN1_9TREE